MKILSVAQIKKLDKLTIQQEPIQSTALMERASAAFCRQFKSLFKDSDQLIYVLCGPGNNGGDGIAIARLLHEANYRIKLIVLNMGQISPDHQYMRHLIDKKLVIDVLELNEGDDFPDIEKGSIIIDGIFGSGLSRPITGYWAQYIEYINAQTALRVAIDIPSGVFPDQISVPPFIKADACISFQLPKLAFFAPENVNTIGQWHVVDIGLSSKAIENFNCPHHSIEKEQISALLKKRNRCDHKGTFGHVLMIAGSFGKMGAAVLATKAALKTGCGLVTAHLPVCGLNVMQISFPEAMVEIDSNEDFFTKTNDLDRFSSIGIGPGLGTDIKTQEGIKDFLEKTTQPLVIDADALNVLALHQDWYTLLPTNSILTPHPKEFKRLFGITLDSFDRWKLLQHQAQQLEVFIVLKGGYTTIATPDGELYINRTGNPGMGTAGSGDVLTGMLSSLLAQGYSPKESALLGVYLHGLAGDIAAKTNGQESLIATDIIHAIGAAFDVLRSSISG